MKVLAYVAAILLSGMCSTGIIDPAEIGSNPNPNKNENTTGSNQGSNQGGNQNTGNTPSNEDTTDPDKYTRPDITTPPATLTQWLDYKESPLNPFYTKYLDLEGLPILANTVVRDTAMYQARYIAWTMLKKVPKAREEMIKCHFRIGVVGYKQNITDLPECKMMTVWWPDTDWDKRGRGYGATLAIPVMSIGEENLVKVNVAGYTEPYWDESIMVHEFAHNVDFAMRRIDKNFEKALLAAFANAKKTGLWKGTYSMDNDAEYFAEGAQAWYDTCRMVVPNVGKSGSFKLVTRDQLKAYDKPLYDVLASVFPEEKLHGYHFDSK